jgi:hypothetical protein
MSYSPCDYMDDVNRALGISMDTENVREVAEAAIGAINALKAKQPQMDRMLYLVAPDNEQCGMDDDGTVSLDLFVWATDASEAVKLWRTYYSFEECHIGKDEKVRVFEVPIMPAAAGSTAVGWDQIHTFGATIHDRAELP